MTQFAAMNLRFSRDPAWLDREYNPRTRVPGYAGVLERWARDAQAARAQGPALLDLRYGLGVQESLDVFPAHRTAGAGPAPVLFFIHGGFWRALDKSDHSFLAPVFQRQGVCVVVVNYALCPVASVPDICLQVARALAWTWRHIGVHGGDASRITVAGHSAGGQLAAMMLACEWPRLAPDLPVSLVRNALSISGLFDLAPLRLAPFLQPVLRLTPAQVRKASPARLPAPTLREGRGGLVAVVGGDESGEFQRQNQLIREAWGEAVVPVCEALPGLNHFSVLDKLVEPKHRLHRLARELLGA